ncbi:C6 zinc finger domain-containing protein [Lophiotrema nucula]|uniref:C6 zinc finger domain-containing protein n=1 Tax=Lophiotrema nucula TaxID=690887 RepID=A0A6A5Z5C4_9PLEO|nr:C6 zinc finger domain-containing protein [Lophiotrema nucula]
MTKRALDAAAATHLTSPGGHTDGDGNGITSDEGSALKKPRAFMATLACDNCRSRKTRCDEDRPKCGYCKVMNLECTYQSPRPTKKDQSMAVAINAIRRLESKIEDLAAVVTASTTQPQPSVPQPVYDHRSPVSTLSQPSPGVALHGPSSILPRRDGISMLDSPQPIGTPGKSPYPISESGGKIYLSFSQHGVAIWPAMKHIFSPAFNAARAVLPVDYVVEHESQRPPLSMAISYPLGKSPDTWLTELPLSVIKGLAEAYFNVFQRNTPVLDKFHFFSSTLGVAMENDFGYDLDTCLVLNVLALGCLAVQAYEEGNFPLPSRGPTTSTTFDRPDWYNLTLDDPSGLRFFNEGRKRMGFLMCQNDLQAAQFYMLSTLYYAQIVRPIESWTTVNRAALCCMSILKRNDTLETLNFDHWEGDMFCRVFWNALMYESIITQELNLPLSGLQDYEADMPIPKFTPCPRPKTSIAGLLVDDDDSFFNFHFLAQAAHRILLSRIKRHMYFFAEKEGSPSATLTDELLHQLEQWRSNLPGSLQFSEHASIDDSPSPAHIFAIAMLRSRYLVAKFHIGRPFLYKALHFPQYMSDNEYSRIADGLKEGLFWPATMGLCTRMKSALPLKFGWCSQCFGQVLLFNAVARAPNEKLRATLPEGWQQWVAIMMELIEGCARMSPSIAKDVELLRLLEW